ncbi:MAG: radical SAM protein [Bacteroidales bacterium]
MSTLLITPPLTGLNTTYPATTVLQGYLRSMGHSNCNQWDMSIALVERIFSSSFLSKLFDSIELNDNFSSNCINLYVARKQYIATVDCVWKFLRNTDPTLAQRIVTGNFLPQGARFGVYDDEELTWAFGSSGTVEQAKHFATLYIQDLTDFIREVVDPYFDLIRYGEQIAMSLPNFQIILDRIENKTIISSLIIELLEEKITLLSPSVIGFTIPFPGCLISAIRCGQYIKQKYPNIKVVFGGGYINTELRSITDSRIFNFVDYIVYDDGELPLKQIIEGGPLVRTAYRNNLGEIVFENMEAREPFVSISDFTGINSSSYISLLELANPMHRLWSDGFWNKITAAHGCYWAKCTFCDTSLDYIGRYDPLPAKTIVDTMERVMKQTGSSGFHFTDEALPPKLLKEIAEEILSRKIIVSYWGNIRFEKAYTAELCKLLAQSGCIAVSGGLEVASPDILLKINKGVTIEQARKAMGNFTLNNIMVHAYLMYGFPTQTLAQTIESLNVVRNMFADNLIQSAFWHCFTMTIHSSIGKCPQNYNAKITGCQNNSFANNGISFKEINGKHDYDIVAVGEALRRATYNYMHGVGMELPVRKWFR